MKKFILAAVAASVVASPVLAAPHQGFDQRSKVVVRVDDRRTDARRENHRPQRFEQRRWNKGERFDSRYARNYGVIQNTRIYKLRDAPRGYRWVQSGNDAVLVGITSGIVAAVMANLIR